jgi:hypothetical protein
MLAPADFSVGSFPEAEGLTLILPRTKYDEPILIADASGEKVAIYLGKHKYDACPCGDSHGWNGLLIPGVSIELDETSLFDPNHDDALLGMVVREGTGLNIIAKIIDNHHIQRAQPITIVADLPPCRERQSAGFTKWQIVLGVGEEKKVLFRVDATRIAAQAAA